jgi:hypothetical protein
LEHLGATDRGVTMFRNQIRRGVRITAVGQDPAAQRHDRCATIPTYCNDTVVRVPPAESAAADRQLLRATGRRLVEAYFRDPPLFNER